MTSFIPRCLRTSRTAFNIPLASSKTISRQFTCTSSQRITDFSSTQAPVDTQTRPPPVRERPQTAPLNTSPGTEIAPVKNTMEGLNELFNTNQRNRGIQLNRPTRNVFDIANINTTGGFADTSRSIEEVKPHFFHVYAHRHNCHITFTSPERNPIISVSNGNIGFKKAGRKSYDSAFQLASYVLGRIREEGWNAKILKLEVSLRGYGAGREAVTKALLGSEGRMLRGKITKVSDATRLKFGGTRSKAPRRLG